MAYLTKLDSAITLDVDTGVLNLNGIGILNAFETANTINGYDPGAGDNELNNGESLGVEVDDGAGGTTTLSGTYRGDVTLTTAAAKLDVVVGNLTLQVNPIHGDVFEADDGSLYLITEEPVNDGRLGVNAVVKGPLGGTLLDLDLPLQEVLADPLLVGASNLIQTTLDTVVVDVKYNPDGTLQVCFARGTMIETPDGPRAIEELSVGDRVVTRDNGIREIRWIGVNRLSSAALANNPGLRPIRIRAGALGDNMPASDLLVSPQHRVLVNSRIAQRMFGAREVLVAAKQLVVLDGIEVAQDVESVDYFHFLLDQHEVVYANGAPSETLFTGPVALRAVGPAARAEIFALFPELRDMDHAAVAARHLPSGRQARKLAMRHVQHHRPLVMH